METSDVKCSNRIKYYKFGNVNGETFKHFKYKSNNL